MNPHSARCCELSVPARFSPASTKDHMICRHQCHHGKQRNVAGSPGNNSILLAVEDFQATVRDLHTSDELLQVRHARRVHAASRLVPRAFDTKEFPTLLNTMLDSLALLLQKSVSNYCHRICGISPRHLSNGCLEGTCETRANRCIGGKCASAIQRTLQAAHHLRLVYGFVPSSN